ncbi:MAG TPA: ABC transporter substrate-binding protein [Ilumatobacteraceae bacterium]|nr:ABC transporter substrate-binding protein [Ilumatobacteraceae bacterium]
MNTRYAPPRRRHLPLVLAVLGITLAAAACGDDDDVNAAEPTATEAGTEAPSSAVASDSQAAAATLPDTITIGYQNVPNGDLVVKHDGLLEQAFGPDVSIEWKLFDSGGSVNEAVLAGGVDIGLVGSSPASRGISSGIEYSVPWIFDVIGKAEALAVRDDSGIATLADLTGKTIATPFASTSHYSLLAALADAGVDASAVNIIDSEPDAIYAAWQQGDIDGAYVWNPNLAKLVAEGGTVLVTSEDLAKKGKTTYDLAVVTNEFAAEFPAAVQIWLDQQNAAVATIKNDPDAAAAAVAAELNITPEEAKQQLSELIFLDAAQQVASENLGGGLADNLYAAAQFNQELGQIDSVQPEDAYQRAVLTTFAAAAK